MTLRSNRSSPSSAEMAVAVRGGAGAEGGSGRAAGRPAASGADGGWAVDGTDVGVLIDTGALRGPPKG